MKTIRHVTLALMLTLAFFALPSMGNSAMNNYCITPPFIVQNIQPNIMVVLDNSLSLEGPAYAENNYDPTQFTSGQYYGYFDATRNYKFTTYATPTAASPNRWILTGEPMTNGTVANPIASGNFLNWATMRRVDVAKKLLIGGRAATGITTPGAYNVAHRTTNPVKLYVNPNNTYVSNFDHDYDNSTTPGIIYPFAGDYNYEMAETFLNVTPNDAGTSSEIVRPTSNVSVPAAWTVYPSSTSAWADVDDTGTGDSNTTYIQNSTSTAAAIVAKTGYAPAIPPTTPGIGFISSVRITIRAIKAGSSTSNTRAITGLIRVRNLLGVETDYQSSNSNLTTSYTDYTFTWATNPATGLAWTFADLTTTGAGSLVGFGIKPITTPTSTNYARATQIYMTVYVTNPSGTYNTVVDQGTTPARGILDNMAADVRFGLAHYNDNYSSVDGGRIPVHVNFGSIATMVSSISDMDPVTATPMSETLHTVVSYFRQVAEPYGHTTDTTGYARGTLANDPFYYDFTDPLMTDSYVPCAKTFVLFLTDGESTYDQNMPGTGTIAACSATNLEGCSGYTPAGVIPAGLLPNPRYAGTAIGQDYYSIGTGSPEGRDFIIDVAFWARTNDMREGSCTTTPTTYSATDHCLPGTQNIVLYPVFLFGAGSTLLKDAAIYGGFSDLNGNRRPDCTTNPKECYRDSNSDGNVLSDGSDDPITYYEGNDGYKLETSITNAIQDILRQASSGTAASVLASGEGSGANIVQAIFYPKRTFGSGSVSAEIDWTATLQNLWYYIDPNLGTSSIREDTDIAPATDNKLELEKDRIVHFAFKPDEQKTKAKLYASDTEGTQGGLAGEVYIEDLKYIWEAGTLLHSRLIGDPRTIYTTTGGITPGEPPILFTTGAAGALQTHLQASSSTEAENIINYIRGDTDVDTVLYRSRMVTHEGLTRIWRLGDIVNSTPRLVSHIPLHTYDAKYADSSYTNFLATSRYTNRGMVFVGGNDGMLHAIKLGNLAMVNDSTSKKAVLSGINRGREEWAFIPKSALPYLKYLMDKDYCHLYYVDATPYIFDASIGEPGSGDISSNERLSCPDPYNTTTCTWRTILVGGMRLGGACKDTAYAGSNGVKVPVAGKGYSSYFALDITNPAVPELLWEFNHPDLGFSTSGPAIIRINARNYEASGSLADETTNGKWFVVFASGPTGPIDIGSHQFKGYSDQPLKLFVFDLRTGPGAANGNVTTISTGIQNAFAGSLNNGNMDYDRDYQDDVLYLGYTKSEDAVPGASTRWTQGGVIRLITREDLAGSNENGTALDPGNWLWSYVAKDIGSVTSSVAHLAHYPYDKAIKPDAAFVYFGSGRYFYKTNEVDNATTQRSLFGIKEPCLTKLTKPITELSDPVCDSGDLADDGSHSLIGNATATSTTDPDGWYITLDPSSGLSCAERVITDPLATTVGAVFFTTFSPNTDICTYGGATYLWGLKYNTGGTVNGLLQGVALLQVSTGSIEELNLSTAFVDKGEGGDSAKGRRSGARIGAPPTGQGLSILTNPPPVKRVLHIRER